MPFTVTWTEATGSKQVSVPNANEAFEQYNAAEVAGAVKIVVKDDHGRTISKNNLELLWRPSGDK